jgi:hypothetical protein
VSATACTAVGKYSVLTGETWSKPTLAETWNGTEWSLQSIPTVSGAKEASLNGVSCLSGGFCMAAGFYTSTAGTHFVLTESRSGSEWKIVSTPEPAGTLNSFLEGVSCVSATECTAVGYYENGSGVIAALVERWNGTEWKIQTVPGPSGATESKPLGVSCAAANACTLVGHYLNSSKVEVPLAEVWNGTEWSVQSVPSPSGATKANLSGVSCTSAAACTATGSYNNSSGVEAPLAERWNGTAWAIQSAPTPEGKEGNLGSGVSCTTSTACTAVGTVKKAGGTTYTTVTEHWNGTEWSIQSTPASEMADTFFSGVSCSETASCAAVGEAGKSLSSLKTFAEIYG